jgi:hypothetical protein
MGGFKRLMTASVAVGAAAMALGIASPALADEAYSCPNHCAAVNGKETWLRQNEVQNLSGTGVCAAIWRLWEGKWTEAYSCTPKPETEVWECIFGPEILGHGQSRRYYAKFEYYLWGYEYDRIGGVC